MSGLSVAAQTWAQWRRYSWPVGLVVREHAPALPESLESDDCNPSQIYEKLMEGFCHACGERAEWESVDVGVGVIYGPWGCYCGWSSDPRYNQLRSDVHKHTDPFGFYYPTRADRAQ